MGRPRRRAPNPDLAQIDHFGHAVLESGASVAELLWRDVLHSSTLLSVCSSSLSSSVVEEASATSSCSKPLNTRDLTRFSELMTIRRIGTESPPTKTFILFPPGAMSRW